MLSSRSTALLKLLLDSVNPLRVKDIAQKFGVSGRTIKYDLDSLRNWLQKYELELCSQPNKGIWLPVEPMIRKRIRSLLEETDSKIIYFYPSDRVKMILLDLLLQDDSIRIAKWMDQFQVSRNTIQSDLTLVEAFLKEWSVALVRNREGIQIWGSERKRRLATEYAIQDFMGSDVMLHMVQVISEQKVEAKQPSQMLGDIFHFSYDLEFQSIIRAVIKMNQLTQEEIGISFTDRTIIGITIRLCIVVHRLSQGHLLDLEENEVSLEKFKVYPIFKDVLHDLSVLLELKIPDHEVAYVCLHMIDLIPDDTNTTFPFDLFKMTEDLVRELSVLTKVDFNQDPDLIYPLFKHISDRVMKYQHGVAEPNPLANDISINYRSLFDHVKQSCQIVFDPQGVHLTDSDIAYIVLHIQASLERIEKLKKYRVLVVCSTGRGMARLLKNKLERDMKNVAVVGSCSVFEAEKMAKFYEADLLVSILPVVSTLPVVVVHPIPTKQDTAAIEKELEDLPEARVLAQDYEPSSIEKVNQNMIQQGLELAKQITTQFEAYLPENRAEGLFYHILFMVNRLMFGTPYQNMPQSRNSVNEKEQELREELLQLLSEREIELPSGELEAILHYFVW